MIKGVGTDLIKIARIEQALEKHGDRFASRILTPDEIQLFNTAPNGVRYLAKRFALKEAVVKALGTGIAKGVGWQNINISNNEAGQPLAELNGMAKTVMESLGATGLSVSLSDEQDYVLAFAVLS
ncbi:holo-ACP synthase [Alkalimarinus sediminis]|uniref:Holo-[acyl-carrier-protein] synthase n=1 Tax=Alkalimarinus sediminis TaxID=1632866 RepID=A0A9E8HME2_9ALTE|nr:holo-ACP synthase [Alkalimarinus sediminis]UZW75541.1 holo-ACP synthase [Alkalimarinus sediminis]